MLSFVFRHTVCLDGGPRLHAPLRAGPVISRSPITAPRMRSFRSEPDKLPFKRTWKSMMSGKMSPMPSRQLYKTIDDPDTDLNAIRKEYEEGQQSRGPAERAFAMGQNGKHLKRIVHLGSLQHMPTLGGALLEFWEKKRPLEEVLEELRDTDQGDTLFAYCYSPAITGGSQLDPAGEISVHDWVGAHLINPSCKVFTNTLCAGPNRVEARWRREFPDGNKSIMDIFVRSTFKRRTGPGSDDSMPWLTINHSGCENKATQPGKAVHDDHVEKLEATENVYHLPNGNTTPFYYIPWAMQGAKRPADTGPQRGRRPSLHKQETDGWYLCLHHDGTSHVQKLSPAEKVFHQIWEYMYYHNLDFMILATDTIMYLCVRLNSSDMAISPVFTDNRRKLAALSQNYLRVCRHRTIRARVEWEALEPDMQELCLQLFGDCLDEIGPSCPSEDLPATRRLAKEWASRNNVPSTDATQPLPTGVPGKRTFSTVAMSRATHTSTLPCNSPSRRTVFTSATRFTGGPDQHQGAANSVVTSHGDARPGETTGSPVELIYDGYTYPLEQLWAPVVSFLPNTGKTAKLTLQDFHRELGVYRGELDGHKIVAKICDAYDDHTLQKEKMFYARLRVLWGNGVAPPVGLYRYENDVTILVLEYKGEPIEQWGGNRTKFLKVLRSIHDYGVEHGDIRPDHVLKDEHGNITIVDYSEAKEHGCGSDCSELLQCTPPPWTGVDAGLDAAGAPYIAIL
ncbi:hypothetical protein CALVIDRAFT_603531 [Calocera viscosa TUFC12733]|uniref:Protein kinase domain-containing protein n=1 Tax=Calocera viscosa (strain TUFC12733) TaxID=1330018 RepID=A0A167FLQ9_CALVF|nr:hypothetical protein CALVIDRAFT_603531 [Calocera viscosa TUFC12733]